MKKLLPLSLATVSLLSAGEFDALKEQLAAQQAIITSLQQKIETIEEGQQAHSHDEEHETHSHHKHEEGITERINLSLTADMSLVGRSISDEQLEGTEMVGFTHSVAEHHDGHTHEMMNDEKGFNFNYAELALHGEVTDKLDMHAVFHLSEEDFEIEELYATSYYLPVTLKAGKFFSNFGHLNSRHHHAWSFADQPLVYEAFLGVHNLLEKGVGASYVLPTDTYLLAGVELLRGENENSFGAAGFHAYDATMGAEVEIEKNDQPNLTVAYVKTAFDFERVGLIGGISYAKGDAIINHGFEEEVADEADHAFVGEAKLWGIDLALRYEIDAKSHIDWQSEYIHRDMDGEHYNIDLATPAVLSRRMEKEQAGYYTQLVWHSGSDYALGGRYEQLNKNRVRVNGLLSDTPDDLEKFSLMAQYNMSDHTFLRIQYNKDRSKYIDEQAHDFDTVMLQLNMTIGGHGHHHH